jgi:hypothetical protein
MGHGDALPFPRRGKDPGMAAWMAAPEDIPLTAKKLVAPMRGKC